MLTDNLKKLVIYGTITLATSSPIIEQIPPRTLNQPVISSASVIEQKQENKVSTRQRDPFVPPKNLKYILHQSSKIIESLDALSRRLERDGFDRTRIQKAYVDERFMIHPEIYHYFIYNPEAKALTYEEYREKLGMTKKMKEAPKIFLKHLESFIGAEERHGVEAFVNAAVLGVESDFGKNLGEFRAFNAAVSLYSTPKKEYAYAQLKALLNITDERDVDFMDVYASYALCGFPGQFQFTNVPSLFEARIPGTKGDLFNIEDWIYSIAHYLEHAGWNPKQNYKAIFKGSRSEKALWNYNHSQLYIQAVLELTKCLRENPEVQLARQQYLEYKASAKPLSNN